ncbi:hypothetical protein Vadar_000835 [Vaccinium darrowii]|uniref:Uncharacterized protein n=1 Tax=Vaccinium darrowii TaxID=229202 RepID=A0ACB7YSJ9_9ERIC|nr:hypothetical protein Vadar_000835 [Vaccinium darrowii]
MISTIDNDSNGQTPLQSGLNKLTSSMRKLGIFVAFLVFLVLLIRYFDRNIKDENGNTEYNCSKTKPGDIINSVIGIIAAAVNIVDIGIPKRLPLAVTLTLAYSKKCMMSDHAMILNLSALETMGSVTTICTDKSGMLTLNEMKVKKFWLGQDFVNGNSSSSIATSVVELLRQGVGLNTTSLVYKNIPVSPMEKAIHSWAVLELNLDKERLMQSCEILHVEAFNSKKKRNDILMRKRGENTMNMHWKGAAGIVLAMCSNYYDVSGNVKVLNDFERKNFDG